jgi:hypothetical protein
VKVTDVPAHIDPRGTAAMLMLAARAGFTVTARLLAALVPHALTEDTVMFPLLPEAPVVTVMLLVVAPAVTLQPTGTVHV